MIQSLELRNFGLQFPGRSLFAGIDFMFPLNSIVLLEGAVGSGRSVLLQILAGLKHPTEGAYFVNDVCVHELAFEEFLPFRKKIGYAFDQGGLLSNRSLLENLTLPLLYHNVMDRESANREAIEMLERFSMVDEASLRPSQVSPVVRKTLGLLRSVIIRPEMLLLDDPSSGMPAELLSNFFDLVSELRKKQFVQHLFLTDLDPSFSKFPEMKVIEVTNHQLSIRGAAA